MPNHAVTESGGLQIGSRNQQHPAGYIDAYSLIRGLTQKPQQAPCPGADVEQITDRTRAQQFPDRGRKVIIADRWLTQPSHIITGQSGAFSEDFCTALMIDQEIVIVLREALQNMPNQIAFRPAQGGMIKNPVSFTEPHQQTRIAQDFQVSRNSWLALRNHAGDFADSQLALGADSQQSESGWFGGSF
jgi:hypothetical protein